MAPTTMQALAMGARAAGRSTWLVAPALLVAFLQSALRWPAPLFAFGIARGGFVARLAGGPEAALSGALEALTAPRSVSILLGLWMAGRLASAALRVAWLSGALPTLGEELARSQRPRPRFAEGLAFGFGPLLGTALLAFALETATFLCATSVSFSVALAGLRNAGGAFPVPAALFGAAALTFALGIVIVASLAADAALARTAILGEGPVRALGEGLRRILLRPGAFLTAALALGAAAVAVLGSARAMETALLGVAQGAPALLVLGPRLLASVMAAALAALFDLWRLGTVAALACGRP